jgi:hypothetical protein
MPSPDPIFFDYVPTDRWANLGKVGEGVSADNLAGW